MPTGYTAEIHDGKDVTFREFALIAARGMGAAIMQRDDGPGPIADEYEVSDYAQKALAKAVAKQAELATLSLADWVQREKSDREESIELDRISDERADAIRARYESMLAQVEAWQPPTSEHEAFKAFMREQLESSIKFDCTRYSPKSLARSGRLPSSRRSRSSGPSAT